jgi:hypothetical protein
MARPVQERHHHKPDASVSSSNPAAADGASLSAELAAIIPTLRVVTAWTLVSVPLAWGVYQTLLKSLALFS